MSRFEKIWLFTAFTLTAVVTAVLIFRFPHPFNYRDYFPDHYWFNLLLRSTYLRLGDLPGLVVPMSSGLVNGYDFIYTSVNSFSQLIFTLPLKIISAVIDLSKGFNFLIATRVMTVGVNFLAFYAFYKLISLAYPVRQKSLRLIAIWLFVSWPIFSYIDTPRWFPLIILLICLSGILSIKLKNAFKVKTLIYLCLTVFALAAIHYYGVVFAFGLSGLAFFVFGRGLRRIAVIVLVCAVIGSFVHTAPIYYYTAKYDRAQDKETGATSIGYYVKNWPKMWKAITLASFGKTEFHINLHGTIPNMLSDVVTTLSPPPPEQFLKLRAALGFKWSRWPMTPGQPRWSSYRMALVGFVAQVILFQLIVLIFFGIKPFERLKIISIRPQKIKSLWRSLTDAERVLIGLLAINVLLYVFVWFRIECEPYARYGIMTLPIGIVLSMLLARCPESSCLKVRQYVFLTIFILLNLFYPLQVEIINAKNRPDYNAYRRLVEWSSQHTADRQLYFDFSDYYHLPAKQIIDGAMPFRTHEFPVLQEENWSFEKTYGNKPTMIVGVSAAMPEDKKQDLISHFAPGKRIEINSIPNQGIGLYYLPKRPKQGDVQIEYMEIVELPGKQYMFFYAGEFLTE